MGCANSVNVTKSYSENPKEEAAKSAKQQKDKNKDHCSSIEERSEESQGDKNTKLNDKECLTKKTKSKNERKEKHQNKNHSNQSTNFQYKANQLSDVQKSNQTTKLKNNGNNKEVIDENDPNFVSNSNKYISIKHPLDNLEDKEIDITKFKNLNINEELEQEKDNIFEEDKKNEINLNKDNNDNDNNNNQVRFDGKIEVTNSIEGRINEWGGAKENNNNNYGDDDDMMNYGGNDDDCMCNLGQSVEIKKGKKENNDIKENNNNEIEVIFEIQSTGEKIHINANTNMVLLDLIEKFKKKMNLPSYEKPEFVCNTEFLIDFDKTIADYKLANNSKINVFI